MLESYTLDNRVQDQYQGKQISFPLERVIALHEGNDDPTIHPERESILNRGKRGSRPSQKLHGSFRKMRLPNDLRTEQ